MPLDYSASPFVMSSSNFRLIMVLPMGSSAKPTVNERLMRYSQIAAAHLITCLLTERTGMPSSSCTSDKEEVERRHAREGQKLLAGE